MNLLDIKILATSNNILCKKKLFLGWCTTLQYCGKVEANIEHIVLLMLKEKEMLLFRLPSRWLWGSKSVAAPFKTQRNLSVKCKMHKKKNGTERRDKHKCKAQSNLAAEVFPKAARCWCFNSTRPIWPQLHLAAVWWQPLNRIHREEIFLTRKKLAYRHTAHTVQAL